VIHICNKHTGHISLMQENKGYISVIKKRILLYLDNQGITKYKFYKTTGISSGVLDKPSGISEEGLLKTLEFYPDLSEIWLLFGKGDMININHSYAQVNAQVNAQVKEKEEEINETVEVYNKGCVNCKDKERIIQQLQVRIKEYQERITELSTERKEYKEEAYLMRTELRILQNEHNNLLNQLNNSNSKAC